MNILPTSPENSPGKDDIERYFLDLREWNFDIAYNAFYAFPRAKMNNEYGESFKEFVKQAKKNHVPPCVQIQSTVGYLDTPELIEAAQYYQDNSTQLYEHFRGWGKKFFFGSFASEQWFEYIMEITRILRGYGFEWVVFEEPMYRVDIPGTKDAFYKVFRERYSNLEYPTKQDESEAYLKMQSLKIEVLTDFYRRCTKEAKKMGYTKVGIMPWFFTPTYENTPIETWQSSCDLGKITFLPEVDFIVVRMQPDNIHGEAMASTGGESLPWLAYMENLSQALGKPTIAVNNPTNEHVSPSQEGVKDLLDYEYFARFTLSAFAAAPSGMSRHWYGKNYDSDTRHMDLYTLCNPFFGRLGGASSSAAMVFSYRGIIRVAPRPFLECWKSFVSLMKPLLYDYKLPILTFFADTLGESLENHPEVNTIILTPYFPVSSAETKFLEKWLKEKPGRRVLYMGGDYGYTYNLKKMYNQWDSRTGPEMLSLFGIEPSLYKPFRRDDRITLEFKGKSDEDAFLGDTITIKTSGIGIPELNNDKTEILYKDKHSQTPVITKREIGEDSYAIYIGISLDGINTETFPIKDILLNMQTDPEYPLVVEADPGILWNRTRAGFIVISNTWEVESRVKIREIEADYWDCRNEGWLEGYEITFKPLDFAVIRIVPKESPLLDILNVYSISNLEESPEHLRIEGCFDRDFCLVTTSPPDELLLNGKTIPWETESIKQGWGVFPEIESGSDGIIEIQWSEKRF